MPAGALDVSPGLTRHASAWVMALANLIPLVGVLQFGWSLYSVILLYWLENAILGGFTFLRVLLARGQGSWSTATPPAKPVGSVAAALFFLAHYGAFWIVHGVFVHVLFDDGTSDDLRPALVLIAVSYAIPFLVEYLWRGGRRTTTPSEEMVRPYGRLLVLHVAILGGASLLQSYGTPLWGLVILVAGKTAMDLGTALARTRAQA